jgi:hypothetical protein
MSELDALLLSKGFNIESRFFFVPHRGLPSLGPSLCRRGVEGIMRIIQEPPLLCNLLAMVLLVQNLGLELLVRHGSHGTEEARIVVLLQISLLGIMGAAIPQHHFLLIEGGPELLVPFDRTLGLLHLIDDVDIGCVLMWAQIDVDVISICTLGLTDVAITGMHLCGASLLAVRIMPAPHRALTVLDAYIEPPELSPAL